MSEASTKTGGTAPPSKDDSYGPDRTLVQVADWLTENLVVLDDLFADAPFVTAVKVQEEMTEPFIVKDSDFYEEFERCEPVGQFSYELAGGDTLEERASPRARISTQEVHTLENMRRLKDIAGQSGETIRARCVMIEEPYFAETFSVQISRNGTCTGCIRYHNVRSAKVTAEHYDVLEQYFVWGKHGSRYLGEEIVLRIWSPLLLDMLACSRGKMEELVHKPSAIYEHPQTLLFREDGFRSLFLMRRPPDKVVLQKDHLEARYIGELLAVRTERQEYRVEDREL